MDDSLIFSSYFNDSFFGFQYLPHFFYGITEPILQLFMLSLDYTVPKFPYVTATSTFFQYSDQIITWMKIVNSRSSKIAFILRLIKKNIHETYHKMQYNIHCQKRKIFSVHYDPTTYQNQTLI